MGRQGSRARQRLYHGRQRETSAATAKIPVTQLAKDLYCYVWVRRCSITTGSNSPGA
ncbi:MAG: hypothetical protein ACLRMJ_03100 [Alistipes finegoldii]